MRTRWFDRIIERSIAQQATSLVDAWVLLLVSCCNRSRDDTIPADALWFACIFESLYAQVQDTSAVGSCLPGTYVEDVIVTGTDRALGQGRLR